MKPLRAAFSRARASAGPEESSAVTRVGVAREVQREGAVIAEAVERAAARDAAGEHAVLALVEKRAGLLAVPRRGEIAHAVLDDFDLARHVAREELGRAAESFLRAHGGIVAREDAFGREQLAQRVDDRRAEALRARRSAAARRAIDRSDRRSAREARRLRRARRDTRWSCRASGVASREGAREALAPPCGVERGERVAVEEAKRDLRCGAAERDAEGAAARDR